MMQSAFLGTCLGALLQCPVTFLSFCGTAKPEWWTPVLPTEKMQPLVELSLKVDKLLRGQLVPKPDNTPEESVPSKVESTSSEQAGQKVVPKLSGPTRFGAGVVMHPGDQGNTNYGPAVVGPTGEVPIPLGMRPPSKEWRSGFSPDNINMMFQFRMDAVRQVTLIGLILVQLFFFCQSTV